jgi:hypothetical protein
MEKLMSLPKRSKERFFKPLSQKLLLGAAMAITIGSSPVAVQAAASESNINTAPTNWTPVLMSLNDTPQAFEGSENQWHLVYDATFTNYATHQSKIEKLEIVAKTAGGEEKIVKTFDKGEIKQFLLALGDKEKGNELKPGQVAAAFINLDFSKREDVPAQFVHRITCDTVDGLGNPRKYVYEGMPINVNMDAPIVIAPPLRGGRWFVLGGYAGELGHRRALFPIDNRLAAAQTYAIDWMLLDDKNYSSHDPLKVEASPCYDQPILAVADGTVVGTLDKFQNQLPNKPEGSERLAYPGGNFIVLQIGKDAYAFYAHLKPGSIKVKEGDKVVKGQEIARLGNSGNTTGPHLHMHITRDPGVLTAHGVPYLFDKFKIVGELKDMALAEKNDAEAKPQQVSESKFAGEHTNQLPREGVVLNFEQ